MRRLRVGALRATSLLLIAGGPAACADTEDVGSSFQEVTGSGGDGGHGGGSSSNSAGPGAGGPGSVASSGSSSSAGHGGASSSSSGSGGEACADADTAEQNETESTAFDLGGIDDCDGSGSEHQGTLAAGDVDWFKYQGDDTFGCVVDPTREVTSMGSFRFCKFAQCERGNPGVTCPSGTTPESSPDGRPGCCGSDGFDLALDCSGSDDNASIYMRLDQPQPACSTYTLEWHY
jgi:hypothetical protein